MKKRLFLIIIGICIFTPFTHVDAKSAAQYITDLSKTDTVNIATDDPEHNPRYIGANPNNYVEFNGETWRIIGVFDGKIKLIRSDYIETGYTAIAWDSSPSNVNGGSGVSYWAQADLMTELNTEYLNSDLSEDTKWYSGSYNAKNAVFDHTKVIKADAKEMIADATWYLGSSNYDGTTVYTNPSQISAETFYNNERLGTPAILNPGSSTSNDGIMDRDKTWTGKVALIYPSDYIYSTSGNATTSRETCLAASGWNTNCANTTWLKSSTNIWTISPATTSERNIYVFTFSSAISNAGLVSWPSNTKTRPSLYLKENVIFVDGDGSNENKYKLGLANIAKFNSNGGSEIDTQYISADEKVIEPISPTKEDSTFLGWYSDEELTTKYNFASSVDSNLELYAKWKFNYKILEGADQTFKDKNITIKTNGNIDKLSAIKINNQVVSSDNYTLKSGSTILTLKTDYLNSLGNGEYKVTFVYDDGSVSTSLNVAAVNSTTNTTDDAISNPKTIDGIKCYVTLFTLSLIGFFTIKRSKIIKN